MSHITSLCLLTYQKGLILQQPDEHVGSQCHRATVQASLYLCVDQLAHLTELSLRPLTFQKPVYGPGQDTLVYRDVGLSLEEAPYDEGRQPEERRSRVGSDKYQMRVTNQAIIYPPCAPRCVAVSKSTEGTISSLVG